MKNLKVMVKLVIGFGAVLTLMLIMTAANLFGLSEITLRGKVLDLVYEIEADSTMLIRVGDDYLIDPDDRYIEQTLELVRSMTETARRVHPMLTFEINRQKAAEIPKLAEAYHNAFVSYVAANKTKEENVRVAVAGGFESDELIMKLNEQINGSSSNPALHETMESAVAGRLAAQLMTARRTLAYQARGYLMHETPDAMNVLEEAYVSLLDTAHQLQSSSTLPASARASLEGALTSVERYMNALREIPELVDGQRSARQEMSSHYEILHQRALELSDALNQLMDIQISRSTTISLSLSIIAIILAILIAWYITRQIVQPLSMAVAIADELGQRNMTGAGVEQRDDEFGTLLRALDTTRSNLRDALGEVGAVTTQLAAAAEELSVVTGQTSSGVNAQRMETEQVATAMNEMAATVHEVAQNSGEAAQAAQKADQQAQSGNRVLQDALNAITRLSGEVEESAQAMYRLNENSDNISTVLTVINGIAEQTNLLALNAAIEAARAGEAGRGFAVVADEVRSLAQRTQESTAQIEDLIDALQQGAKSAVEMMDSSSELAGGTLKLAQQAGSELEAITRTVSEIQAMNMQIATAAEEQSSVAEEINRSVLNVNNIADQSASAVEEMAASSADLARLGQSLQDLVTQFRT